MTTHSLYHIPHRFTSITVAFLLLLSLSVKGQEKDGSVITDSVPASTWTDILCRKLSELALEAERNYYYTGISVFDLTTDSLVFGYNQQKMMRPASTQKLLTAISVLDRLGASHRYVTLVYADGAVWEETDTIRVLNGNVFVIGDFDPKLNESHLLEIADSIKALGISRIDGYLVADLSMKDTLALGNGWCWDDKQPYLTPLGLEGDAYKCERYKINRYNPSVFFLQRLIEYLQASGINVKGYGTGNFKENENARLICSIVHSVEEVLNPMMKDSDNLYAESIFFQLAADTKKGVSWKDCANIVNEVIQKSGNPLDCVKVADGSGLSLYNYATPGLQVAMLRYAYHQERIFSTLYNSLPISGLDGTLKNRMTIGNSKGKIRAKTGTVTGVSSLAGYAIASNGHLLAFSVINNGVRTSTEGQKFQDRVCAALTE